MGIWLTDWWGVSNSAKKQNSEKGEEGSFQREEAG